LTFKNDKNMKFGNLFWLVFKVVLIGNFGRWFQLVIFKKQFEWSFY
jgi:hypothetical protein